MILCIGQDRKISKTMQHGQSGGATIRMLYEQKMSEHASKINGWEWSDLSYNHLHLWSTMQSLVNLKGVRTRNYEWRTKNTPNKRTHLWKNSSRKNSTSRRERRMSIKKYVCVRSDKKRWETRELCKLNRGNRGNKVAKTGKAPRHQ